jgi:hypothetical protein
LSFRVDDLLPEFHIPQPNHIKIDVDGTELSVLKGADQTLSNPALKSLLLELDEGREGTSQTLEYLRSKGLVFQSKHRYIYGCDGRSSKVHNYIFHRPSSCTCPSCAGARS